jgi:geranylgeranyl pyrophosphate synthase
MTASRDQLLDHEFYLQKTYCKTASLMSNSAKSIAVLSGESEEVSILQKLVTSMGDETNYKLVGCREYEKLRS